MLSLCSILLVSGVAASGHFEIPVTRVPYNRETDANLKFGKQKLGAATGFEIPISLRTGFKYMGPIYLGSSNIQANVTFDTGSSWLTVTSTLCVNCPSEVYSQS